MPSLETIHLDPSRNVPSLELALSCSFLKCASVRGYSQTRLQTLFTVKTVADVSDSERRHSVATGPYRGDRKGYLGLRDGEPT